MLDKDGTFVFFIIVTRTKDYRRGQWFQASLDHFGSPPGFSASGDCWQQIGERGTFDEDEAKAGLLWMAKKHPKNEWGLQRVEATQNCEVILTHAKQGKEP